MRINELSLSGFRNYHRQSLTFDPDCNVIYGENAQGKTNLLEAVVYLSCGKSPRTHADRELIGFDAPGAVLEGRILSRDRDFVTRIELNRGKKRKMTVNGVAAKNAAALSDVLHTVFFAPEDLFLIRDGAAARRKFMDLSLCQLRPRYAEALAEYSRLASFCEKLRQYAAQAHAECSGGREELSLQYKTVKTVTDPLADASVLAQQLAEHQQSHYAAEIASRLCLSGPHKDDIEVSVNGHSARQFCSQGQVRTAALALKLADREIHKNTMGEYPIMLLDDVLSELDPRRQEYVLNRIAGGQVFITCCENDRLDTLLSGKVFHIRGGEVLA